MTEVVRSVAVRLSAQTSAYLTQMKGAGAETKAVSRDVTRSINRDSATQTRALRTVATTAKYVGGAVAIGLGVAVKESANFSEKMALVQTLSHATAREMRGLSRAALESGQGIGFTATEVADAEAELIKAGVGVQKILGGGLRGALELAAAGQTDVATATEIAASALTQFQLRGKDIPHLADLLSAGADKALGSVTDLGEGLKQAGTTAHQMGYDVDQTVGTLAAFAQAGLIGERGGTTFKQMLLQLAAPTGVAQKIMDKLHLSLYKANGQIKTMPELADNLQRSLSKLTPEQRNYALGVIFGSRAIQGANILLANGAKGIQSWINKVNDQGFAAGQASGKLNSLKGDLQKLEATAQTAFITLGSGSQSPLRHLVQNVTGELHKVTENGDLQRWSSEVTRDITAVAVAARPVGGAVGGILKELGTDAREVADAFNSLPADVQKIIATGAVVAYGANKLGLLKPLVRDLGGRGRVGGRGALGSAATNLAPIPVFVVNLSAGGLGGASGLPGRGGKVTTPKGFRLPPGTGLVATTAGLALIATGKPSKAGVGSTAAGAVGGGLVGGLPGALFGAAGGALDDLKNTGSQTKDVLKEAVDAIDGGKLKQQRKALADLQLEASRLSRGGLFSRANFARGIDELTGRRKDLQELADTLKDLTTITPNDGSMAYLLGIGPRPKAAKEPKTPADPLTRLLRRPTRPGKPHRPLEGDALSQVLGIPAGKVPPENLLLDLLGVIPTTTAPPSHDRRSIRRLEASLGLDTKNFNHKAQAAQNTLDFLRGLVVEPKVDLDTRRANRKLAALERKLSAASAGFLTPFTGTSLIGPGHAAGGTVAGLRTPYRDKVLTPTAPGEFITANDRGQADMNRAALQAGNAGARLMVAGQPVMRYSRQTSGQAIDYERLARAMANVRPLYGDVHVIDGYGGFRRQIEQDRQTAALGGGRHR
jgi:TP901 family phage tail tape measure protein